MCRLAACTTISLHGQHGDLQQRDQIERVVVQDTAQQPGVPIADKIVIGRGDLTPWNVLGPLTATEMSFERLQAAVGQSLAPFPSCVVE